MTPSVPSITVPTLATTSPIGRQADSSRTEDQQAFAAILSQSVAARGTAGARPTTSLNMNADERKAQARQAAEDFVAVAFVQPIFKNLRNSHLGPELPPPLGPGPGEKQFRSLADSQVARQLVKATKWPVVENLTDRLLHPKAGRAQFTTEALKNAPTLPGSPAFVKQYESARTPQTTPAQPNNQTERSTGTLTTKTKPLPVPFDTTVTIAPRSFADPQAARTPIALTNPADGPRLIPLETTNKPVPLRSLQPTRATR